jgi:lipoprotein NlpI
MKNHSYYVILIAGLAASACTTSQMAQLAKQQNLAVNPNPLEVHKDTVSFEMSATLPVKMLKPGSVYTLNTYYKAGDKDRALDPIAFKSDDFPQAATQQPKLTKKFNTPYDVSMKSGILQVEGVASKSGKSKSLRRPWL